MRFTLVGGSTSGRCQREGKDITILTSTPKGPLTSRAGAKEEPGLKCRLLLSAGIPLIGKVLPAGSWTGSALTELPDCWTAREIQSGHLDLAVNFSLPQGCSMEARELEGALSSKGKPASPPERAKGKGGNLYPRSLCRGCSRRRPLCIWRGSPLLRGRGTCLNGSSETRELGPTGWIGMTMLTPHLGWKGNQTGIGLSPRPGQGPRRVSGPQHLFPLLILVNWLERRL